MLLLLGGNTIGIAADDDDGDDDDAIVVDDDALVRVFVPGNDRAGTAGADGMIPRSTATVKSSSPCP